MGDNVSKNIVVAIAGPTAVGKTSISIEVARALDTEIVSADSRQIYRQMTIGTAKPTTDELAQVGHHFIDTIDITQPYTAGDFERDALKTISQLHEEKHYVVMSGGSGLYHKAVLEGFDDFPSTSGEDRDKWQQIMDIDGISELQNALRKRDPEYAAVVDLQNAPRLIRALSVIDVSGQPFSTFLNKARAARPFHAVRIFLNIERDILYQRINARVDQMLADGLVAEVTSLLPYRDLQALQTVGYKEIFKHLDGEWSLDEAVSKIKQHSRNYAKRQVTWYRNQGEWKEVAADVDDVLRLIRSQ